MKERRRKTWSRRLVDKWAFFIGFALGHCKAGYTGRGQPSRESVPSSYGKTCLTFFLIKKKKFASELVRVAFITYLYAIPDNTMSERDYVSVITQQCQSQNSTFCLRFPG